MESRTHSQNGSKRAMARSPNAQGDGLAPEHAAEAGLGPSHAGGGEETDTDVEIVEEGDKGETSGPVSTVMKGQLDLTLETYRIG